MAYAIHSGSIRSIDDEVIHYLPNLDHETLRGTTIRHLLTHTHGVAADQDKRIYREFPAGQSWAYRGAGVDMLTEIVRQTTGQTIADIVSSQVLSPLHFRETGWYAPAHAHERLVDVIRNPNDPHWKTSESTAGDQMNMYVSTSDLAKWGYLHLKEGLIRNEQVVPREVLRLATTHQSPKLSDVHLPQNGFLWFVKDQPANRTEIGNLVPRGSFQILGYTGVTLLVIPKHNLVAVRMFNRFGSPAGYDYLKDVRDFGDTVIKCIQ